MRLAPALALVLLAPAALAGCLEMDAFPDMPPMSFSGSFGPDWGSAEVSALRVETTYDPLTGRLDVRASGSLSASGAPSAALIVVLAAGGCPTQYGPGHSSPGRVVDRETFVFRIPGERALSTSFEARLGARFLPGQAYAVDAVADASSLFESGVCREGFAGLGP